MSANKPQPQQGGQKPGSEEEFEKGSQQKPDQGRQQQGGQNIQDNPNKGGQGTQQGNR